MKLGDPEIQTGWLAQDIPHRLRAALAQSTFLDRMLEQQIPEPERRGKITAFFLDMAAWEGRHAAMLWLIEFVGIAGDENGKAVESPRRKGFKRFPHDVDIEEMPGGKYFPLGSDDADLLGQVWKGAKQATGHPTIGSDHPSLARDRLTRAASIVAAHLEATVYRHAERPLVL